MWRGEQHGRKPTRLGSAETLPSIDEVASKTKERFRESITYSKQGSKGLRIIAEEEPPCSYQTDNRLRKKQLQYSAPY